MRCLQGQIVRTLLAMMLPRYVALLSLCRACASAPSRQAANALARGFSPGRMADGSMQVATFAASRNSNLGAAPSAAPGDCSTSADMHAPEHG